MSAVKPILWRGNKQSVSPLAVRGSYKALAYLDRSITSRYLLRQLVVSPICKEIGIFGSNGRALLNEISKWKGVSEASLMKVNLDESKSNGNAYQSVAFNVSKEGCLKDSEDFVKKAQNVSHFNFLSDLRGSGESDLLQLLKDVGFRGRTSVFKTAMILPGSTETDNELSLFTRISHTSYPIISQFLPVRYRQVYADDLALAIRLNAELCLPEHQKDASEQYTVERLFYSDCMQVIGRDDLI